MTSHCLHSCCASQRALRGVSESLSRPEVSGAAGSLTAADRMAAELRRLFWRACHRPFKAGSQSVPPGCQRGGASVRGGIFVNTG